MTTISSLIGGGNLKYRIFTTSTTWTPDTGGNTVSITVIGGGGGGGGGRKNEQTGNSGLTGGETKIEEAGTGTLCTGLGGGGGGGATATAGYAGLGFHHGMNAGDNAGGVGSMTPGGVGGYGYMGYGHGGHGSGGRTAGGYERCTGGGGGGSGYVGEFHGTVTGALTISIGSGGTAGNQFTMSTEASGRRGNGGAGAVIIWYW